MKTVSRRRAIEVRGQGSEVRLTNDQVSGLLSIRLMSDAEIEGLSACSERRAVMMGGTVRILSDDDGYRGRYGEVIVAGPCGVLVKIEVGGKEHRISYMMDEVSFVPMNDIVAHVAADAQSEDLHREEYALVNRAVRLKLLRKHWALDLRTPEPPAERCLLAAERRSARLSATVRNLQRRWREANWSPCTSLVVYAGGQPS